MSWIWQYSFLEITFGKVGCQNCSITTSDILFEYHCYNQRMLHNELLVALMLLRQQVSSILFIMSLFESVSTKRVLLAQFNLRKFLTARIMCFAAMEGINSWQKRVQSVSRQLYCRNGAWTESSVQQPRITTVTDDEELKQTKRQSEKCKLSEKKNLPASRAWQESVQVVMWLMDKLHKCGIYVLL